MNVEYKEFIGVYKNVYMDGYCQHMIEEFEQLSNLGLSFSRKEAENAPKHRKDDLHVAFNLHNHSVNQFNGINPNDIFFEGLHRCFTDYMDKFSILRSSSLTATHIKVQRTDSGGGYHIWHAENCSKENLERAAVYMLYLNSLEPEDGGETEFLYQKMRFRPEENTMLIWPGSYTHAHRGNTVLGKKSKYIITGWFYYE